MTRLLQFREYERQAVTLSDLERTELIAAAGTRLGCTATETTGRYEVRATSHVGTIVTDHLRVLIRPKVSIENVLYLLEAAGDPIELGPRSFDYQGSADLLSAIAGFYARQVEIATRRGVLRAYRNHEERLVAIRGRIDVTEQLKATGVATPVACRFDEYTADVDENRILKAALVLTARLSGVPDRTRRLLASLALSFDEVADVAVDPFAVDRVVFDRLNQHYATPLRLARLILRWSSLADRSGRHRASVFLVNMNEVFEQFIEFRLRDALRGRLDVRNQYLTHLDVEDVINMRPDLVLRQQGRDVYVADAKYKLTDDGLGKHPDYYQLLAYTTAMRLPEGMLIYCHNTGEAPPREVVARGNNKRLVSYRIPLGGSITDIDSAVADLADELCGRVEPTGALVGY